MGKNSILIVDDDLILLKTAEEILSSIYTVSVAKSGKQAITLLKKGVVPDLILLDIAMPEMDGYTTLEKMKSIPNCQDIPVIFLTGFAESDYEVKGLKAGAVDYIVKPFAIEELLARIRATFRRQDIEATKKAPAKASTYRDLKLDVQNRAVVRGDEVIPLTKREFDLLNTLLSNMNQVMTREELLLQVWKYDDVIETNVVDVYIRYLRGKIDIPGKESYIQTVRGMGYVIRER